MLSAFDQLHEALPNLGWKQRVHIMLPDNTQEWQEVEVINTISFHIMKKLE